MTRDEILAAFDLGAFTVLPGNHQIVFSRLLMGGDDTKAKLLAHHGAGLTLSFTAPRD